MRAFSAKNSLILIIDNNNQNFQVLDSILTQAGYIITRAISRQQALELIQINKPDLILLDLNMPDINGLQVYQILKSNLIYQDIPILLLTASQEKQNLLEAFELGAVDYVSKPINSAELLTRVRTHLELKYTKDQLNQAITELNKLSSTDPLTGLFNRRHFLTLAEQELNRSCRYNYSLSIFILELDNFKQFDDPFSHFDGDNLLQLIAKTIIQSLRKEDLVGRFGEESFIVLLPQTPTNFALKVAQRLQEKMNNVSFTFSEKPITLIINIGVATYKIDDENIEQLLKRANQALLDAKNLGRNQIVVHQNDVKNVLAS